MPSVFFSYSHHDEALRDQLETQLAMLKRQGVIDAWHDRRIGAGEDLGKAIDEHIEGDDIILLLVSPDFIASDYCYNKEMTRAMERHEAGQAIVIPVILRACEWHHAPFGKLMATPPDGKPIQQWTDIDEAFLQVAKAVRGAAERFKAKSSTAAPTPAAIHSSTPSVAATASSSPRSSNLRLTKTFTQLDQDNFLTETFDFIARYFENSLNELGERNSGCQGVFRRVDANRFFATIYLNGKDVARGTVYMGGMFGRGISYVQGETTQSNSMNESLSVAHDDQTLYLTSFGMAHFGQDRNQKLTQEGAAEYLWSMVIEPLQQRRNS